MARSISSLISKIIPRDGHSLIIELLLSNLILHVLLPSVALAGGLSRFYDVIRLGMHPRQLGIVYIFVRAFIVSHSQL
jgi:hypothetical protein